MSGQRSQRRERGQPVPLSSGLEAVVRSLSDTDATTVRNVFDGWDEAVGPAIAAHARPVKLDGTTLIVDVDEPGWATQLRYLQSELIERLSQRATSRIERVEVRVAGGRGRRRSGASAPSDTPRR